MVADCSRALSPSTVTEGWRIEAARAAVTSACPGPVPCVVSPILTDPPLAQSTPGLLNTLTKHRRWLLTPALTSGSANAGASLEQGWRSSTQVIVLELWTGPGLPTQLWKRCATYLVLDVTRAMVNRENLLRGYFVSAPSGHFGYDKASVPEWKISFPCHFESWSSSHRVCVCMKFVYTVLHPFVT